MGEEFLAGDATLVAGKCLAVDAVESEVAD